MKSAVFLFYVHRCFVYVYDGASPVGLVTMDTRRRCESSGTEVTDGCELCGCWELNLRLLEEQTMPSMGNLSVYFRIKYLEINLTSEILNIFIENYETLMK